MLEDNLFNLDAVQSWNQMKYFRLADLMQSYLEAEEKQGRPIRTDSTLLNWLCIGYEPTETEIACEKHKNKTGKQLHRANLSPWLTLSQFCLNRHDHSSEGVS